MIAFPNAKINIGLQVTEKRSDGFHNLISCFYPIPWTDILEIVQAKNTSFTSSGIAIPDSAGGNLCTQAYELLREDFDIPPVHIHLHKIIPIGAGLGGGSSDAAFSLKILNNLFQLELSNLQLEEYARKLGSDCAFFIQNIPVLAKEKGDRFDRINFDLKGTYLTLIYPNLHISTKEAYSGIVPHLPTYDLKKTLETKPLPEWKSVVFNDFESSLFPKRQLLAELKENFYSQGADYAAMTGSGSTLFALSKEKISNKAHKEHLVFNCQL